MNRIKHIHILFVIIIIASALRFFMLGQNPPSLNWDETSIGYNAYSILKTGKDEYGNFLPLEFRSFEDYKPPVYIYLTVPSVLIFGLTEFAVRFPAALFGVLSILIFYFLIKEAFLHSKHSSEISLIASFLLAISPWHLQFSRAAYEGNVGLFFIMLGSFLFLRGLRMTLLLPISVTAFVLSIYSYHSFRLVVPLFILALLLFFRRELLKVKSVVILSAVFFVILTVPVYAGFFSPAGSQSRLSMVTIFGESEGLKEQINQLETDKAKGNLLGQFFHNRRVYFLREGIKNYLDHFSPNYLFVIGAGSFHHHAKDVGMMFLVEFPFLLTGLLFLLKKLSKKSAVIVVLLLLAPLPAAITTGTPHGVRSIAMIPGLILIVSIGIVSFKELLDKSIKKNVRQVLTFSISLIALVNFVYYLNQYYSVTPIAYGYFWQFGNKEAILKVKELEKNYESIVMTYEYDQPYVYYLFYNRIEPSWYQTNWAYQYSGNTDRFYRKIGKYEFKNISEFDLKNSKNTLFIGTPSEIPDPNPLYEIYFPDGRVAYKIVGR